MLSVQPPSVPASLRPTAPGSAPPARLQPLRRAEADTLRRGVPTGTLPAAAAPVAAKRPLSPLVKGEVHLNVPHRYQGKEWSCGTSSLWMVLQYHKPEGVDFQKLDNSVRPTRQFGRIFGTSPGALAGYVKEMKLDVATTTNGSTYDLRRMLDRGLPVVLLGDRGSRLDPSMHYRVLTGYKGTDDRDTTWTLRDALIPDGKELTFTTQELLAFWGNLAMFDVKIPFERPMVVVAPEGHQAALPKDKRSTATKLFDSVFKTAGRALITAEHILNFGPPRSKAAAAR